jgi:hypothetical protein
MYTEFRYLLASLDYRFVHVTAKAPADFGTFNVAPYVRTPIEIVRHLCDLLALIQRQFGQEQAQAAEGTFEAECERFRDSLRTLDGFLAHGLPLEPTCPELGVAGLLQGPVSDALTHLGQLALLRRLAGSPVERVRYWQVEMPAPASRSHGSEGANTL